MTEKEKFVYENPMECVKCGEITNELENHLVKKHKMSGKTYYDSFFIQKGDGICVVCGAETNFEDLKKLYKKTCGFVCSTKKKEKEERERQAKPKEPKQYITNEMIDELLLEDSETKEEKEKEMKEKFVYNIKSMICKICGEDVSHLSYHIKNIHPEISAKDYYDTFHKQEGEGLCDVCGKETKFRRLSNKYPYEVRCCKKSRKIEKDNKDIKNECLECGRKFKTLKGLGRHLRIHGGSKKYYDKFFKKEDVGICVVCDAETNFRGVGRGYSICCSQKCSTIRLSKRIETKITKEEINKASNYTVIKEKFVKTDELYCKFCGKKQKSAAGLVNHSIKSHGVNSKEYYDMFYKQDDEGVCYCGKKTKLYGWVDGYSKYCSKKCSARSPERLNIFKKTCLEKYGVESPLHSKEIRKKIDKTRLKNMKIKQSKTSKWSWIRSYDLTSYTLDHTLIGYMVFALLIIYFTF